MWATKFWVTPTLSETSWDLDLSVEYQLTSWLWGSIGLYRSLLSNQISSVQCPDEPLGTFRQPVTVNWLAAQLDPFMPIETSGKLGF